ncbi:MAG: hypoxanthine-guanine phosphoribosyltransferase [Gammaproteobacteria bacterium]
MTGFKADILEDYDAVLRDADMLCTPEQVSSAFDGLARAIAEALQGSNPLLLPVMIGGLVPAGRLITRLDFPLDIDYIHATRYRGETRGAELQWRARPQTPIAGRTVLVLDDILDEGLTLAAIVEYCKKESAERVLSAVLVDKQHDRKPAMAKADFTGLSVPDRYVFGCGMDYQGRFRNLGGIYAVGGL